jgi:glutaredoxin-like protein
MTFLDAKTKTEIKTILESVTTPLELILYTLSPVVVFGEEEPGLQNEARGLLSEVSELCGKITLIERPIAGDLEAKSAGITHGPTIVLREAGSYRTNIRFLGLPSGYEFRTLIETILLLGTGKSDLGDRVKSELDKITTPVLMQSFVTPGCPYCPKAVLTAFKFAFHNPSITAEGIEANEFQSLSAKHRISSVPDTIISSSAGNTLSSQRVLGAQPDRAFIEAALQVAGISA